MNNMILLALTMDLILSVAAARSAASSPGAMEERRGKARGVEGEGRRKPRVACMETRRRAAATKRQRMILAGGRELGKGLLTGRCKVWCVLGLEEVS